jgi:hypothetical protein
MSAKRQKGKRPSHGSRDQEDAVSLWELVICTRFKSQGTRKSQIPALVNLNFEVLHVLLSKTCSARLRLTESAALQCNGERYNTNAILGLPRRITKLAVSKTI